MVAEKVGVGRVLQEQVAKELAGTLGCLVTIMGDYMFASSSFKKSVLGGVKLPFDMVIKESIRYKSAWIFRVRVIGKVGLIVHIDTDTRKVSVFHVEVLERGEDPKLEGGSLATLTSRNQVRQVHQRNFESNVWDLISVRAKGV